MKAREIGMKQTATWIKAERELPAEGKTVIFLTAAGLSAIGCMQYVKGQPVWFTEFAPWGEFEVDAPLDTSDPEMQVTHWAPVLPPPLPED